MTMLSLENDIEPYSFCQSPTIETGTKAVSVFGGAGGGQLQFLRQLIKDKEQRKRIKKFFMVCVLFSNVAKISPKHQNILLNESGLDIKPLFKTKLSIVKW